jgi:integrase
MAHLYKRRNKYWICYYVKGEKIQESLHTDNERIAREKKRKIEYDLSIGSLHIASQLPVTFVLEDFCRYLETARTYKSYKNDISRLRVFFGPVCERLKICPPGIKRGQQSAKPMKDKYADSHAKAQLLEDISPRVINRFLAERATQDSWSPKTQNLMRETLHRLFAYAIKHHGFRSRDPQYPNPAAGVDRLREPAPQIRFLSLEEIEEQLKALEEHPVIRTMVATYIYAGVRREEAIWLTPEDVDMANRLIRIRAKTIGGEKWQPKTKRNRSIPIGSRLFAVLSEYRPPARSTWFFPSPTEKRWDPDNFSQDLRTINKAAGLDWSCLDFRHTFGSHLAQKGESLYKIAELLGNSPEICRRHYAALMPEKMRDTVEFEDSPLNHPDSSHRLESMLQEVLSRLGDQNAGGKVPLRLVKFGE